MRRKVLFGLGGLAITVGILATTAVAQAETDDETAAPHAIQVRDCPSGYSIGTTGTYAQGGGEETSDIAIRFISDAVAQEYGSFLQPEVIEKTNTRVVVRYSDQTTVMAEGAVHLAGKKWQLEGLTQCAVDVSGVK